MKTKRLQSGFTLVELLVAMAITVILLGVLVYMTGISMDTYKNSRNEVRASRQAKEAVETLAKDFEGLMAKRDGNTYEWLYAEVDNATGREYEAANAGQLIFFTGATDRYNGDIGGIRDRGGDISTVGYRLKFKDQILDNGSDKFATFSLYRQLVNPDETFNNLLAKDNLKTAYSSYGARDCQANNFLVENVYEFTVTFLVEYSDNSTTPATTRIERVTLSPSAYSEFRLKGDGIQAVGPGSTNIANGSLIGVEISISVITDNGLSVMKHVSKNVWRKQQDKYTYHYTKTINTPRP